MTKPATRTVKVSDATIKKIKVGAAVLGCTQEDFVCRAVEALFQSAEIVKEIESFVEYKSSTPLQGKFFTPKESGDLYK